MADETSAELPQLGAQLSVEAKAPEAPPGDPVEAQPAPSSPTVVQPAPTTGLVSAAEAFEQLDDVFSLASFKTIYIYLLGKFERDLNRANERLDEERRKYDTLRDTLARVASENEVLKVKLGAATRFQAAQTVLSVVAGVCLSAGLQSVLPNPKEPAGWIWLVLGVGLLVVAWLIMPKRDARS